MSQAFAWEKGQALTLILSFTFGKLRTAANSGLRQTQDDELEI
jgi:hypothetical protein